MNLIQLDNVLETSVVEVRGDGKAGGGLVLTMQSFAGLFVRSQTYHVQEWPFFSSARRGAAVRAFLRVSKNPISIACEVNEPHVAILMDDGAAKFVDFAQGVPHGGTFIVNTTHTHEEVAKHYKLSGRVITISGDRLGETFLKSPRGNISVFAALVRAFEGLDPSEAKAALLDNLQKRRLPTVIQKANAKLFDASLDACQVGVHDYAESKDHQPPTFESYGDLTAGAQTPLRLSASNKTANYARTGGRVFFEDPDLLCNGCTFCIVNCPEDIIQVVPDEERGVLVTGADFTNYCKYCRECIEVCPENLFVERTHHEVWED